MSRPPSARPTLEAIAAEAGVSVPTVSKVLNRRSDVAPTTRARVKELIAARGYRRHAPQHEQVSGGTVDLVTTELANSWAGAILQAVEAAAFEASLEVVVSVDRSSQPGFPDSLWLERALHRRSRGVLAALIDVTAAQRRQLAEAGIPLVVIDPVSDVDSSVVTVGSANWVGGYRATEHLIAQGHRHIGIIGGPPNWLYSEARIGGYRSALAKAGLEVVPAWIRHGNFHRGSGVSEMAALLEGREPPTAVFACSDQMALGAYDAAAKHGLRIPDDVSIVGFDDLPEADWMSPRLTTIRQPIAEMGATAIWLLVRLTRGERIASPHVELSTQLVARDSVGPPRSQRSIRASTGQQPRSKQ